MIVYHAKENSTHNPQFRWRFYAPHNYYLFVLYRVKTIVRIDDSYIDVPAGSCILYDKTALQEYRPAGDTPFCHDFFHFDIREEADRHALAGIPLNTPLRLLSTDKITALVGMMARQLHSQGENAAMALSCLAQALLYMVKEALQLSRTSASRELHFDTLYQLREQIYRYPGQAWSVEHMCRLTHLSSSHLQTLYRKYFLVSCNKDVIQARIRMASSLLQYTNLSIRSVAETCGYDNAEHFVRQFRKSTDSTPLQFRKKFRNADR